MMHPSIIRIRKLLVFVVLGIFSGNIACVAQPPERPAGVSLRPNPAITREWSALRRGHLEEEYLDPHAAITRYQHFYEERGHLDAEASVRITSLIAQLYWQNLHDQGKALSIYQWGIKLYSRYPGSARLRREEAQLREERRPTAALVHFPALAAEKATPIAKLHFDGLKVNVPQSVIPSQQALPPAVSPLTMAGTSALNIPDTLSTPTTTLHLATQAVGLPPVKKASAPSVEALNVVEKTTFWTQLQAFPKDAENLWQSSGLPFSYLRSLLAKTDENSDAHQKIRLAIAGLLARHDIELLAALANSPGTLSPDLRLAVADYHASLHDAKAIALYEGLLLEVERAGPRKNGVPALEKLAEYYKAANQPAEAAAVLARIDKYTTSTAWIGNDRVDAARLYRQVGDNEKAEELYQKVITSTDDWAWARGLALIDQGRALMTQQKYEEAIKVLSTPVTGQYNDQIEPVKRMLVGDAYYQNGDLTTARENMQSAITAYHAVQNPVKGEGLENIFTSAEKRLEMMNRWIKEPIQIDPNEVHIAIDKNQLQKGPVFRRLLVRTYRNVPLTATINNKNVTAQILSLREWGQLSANSNNQGNEKEVIIKVTALPQGGSNVLLTISSAKYESFTVQAHIYLDVNEM